MSAEQRGLNISMAMQTEFNVATSHATAEALLDGLGMELVTKEQELGGGGLIGRGSLQVTTFTLSP